MLVEGYAGLVRVQCRAHGLEHEGFLPQKIGNKARTVVIVDAKDLKDGGIGQKRPGALTVSDAELVNILQDWPELDAIIGHQAHSAFYGELDCRAPRTHRGDRALARPVGQGSLASGPYRFRLRAIIRRSQQE